MLNASGGTYEDPKMAMHSVQTGLGEGNEVTGMGQEPVKASTAAREAFFLSFATKARERFPYVPLMVTGGFRTRSGMNSALKSGACDLIGIGRPAAIAPKLPQELLQGERTGEEVNLQLKPVERPWWVKYIPLNAIHSGFESFYYGSQIQRMAKGLTTIDTRVVKT